MKYGEIYFLGKCNAKCYYCLSKEMSNLKKDDENQMVTHFKEWENFDEYVDLLKENDVKKIYLSSVTTEPMMYKYLDELVDYLRTNGFKVGIRTNGYFANDKMDTLLKLDEEISFSINSFNEDINYEICGLSNIPDWDRIFNEFDRNGKKCRVSIVVNRYNEKEIPDALEKLSKYKCIDYVQLRRVYKYEGVADEDIYYDRVVDDVKANGEKCGNFFESEIYNYKGVKVSLWSDVFKKESVSSINYFTNGLVSDHNLLVPAYENKEGAIDMKKRNDAGKSSDVISYYENDYEEDERLGDGCDNRHLVEREVKKQIISDYVNKGDKVLEIGAGTGLYSIYFAKKGAKVTATDLVHKHVDIINRKIENENLDMNAMTSDALHLPFDDEEFDVVLLSGPIYHLSLLEDKNQAISEASRVCKNDGTVVVDYLPKIHGFIQHVLLSNEFLKGMNNEEIEKYDCKDDMFSYDDSATIKDVMNKNYISNVKVYGTDSITRFIKEEINLLKDEDLSKWVVFVKSISDNPGVVELSEHALAIGKKDRVLKR